MEKPCLVFCCHARKDQKFLLNLKTHLRSLEREELITLKADIDVTPGTEWETNIMHNLAIADILLLLISPDFIASDYCFNEEMRQAIARHEQGTTRVIPVIIRPASWSNMPFSNLQALPKDAVPISTSPNRDLALLNVVEGIRTVVYELRAGTTADQKSEEHSWQPSAQEKVLPPNRRGRSAQERIAMNTKDDSDKYSIKNEGNVIGQVIGGQHGQVFSGEGYTVIINNAQKDGMHALERGAKALLHKDFSSAKKELHMAIEAINQDEHKVAAARARYFQVLAILGNEHPRDKGIAVTERISELLTAAINLDQRNTYIMTRALIISPSLRPQTHKMDITSDDKKLLEYLQLCQPELYYRACQVFGI